MATGPRFAVKFRRRRIGKTDYHKRLGLLKSKLPRVVVRKTNQFINSQIINYDNKGDKTVISASSGELSAFGWKSGFKNRPAAYLTGFLIAKKAAEKKIEKVVVDFGVYTLTKGNKLFAFLRGMKDSGMLQFSVSEESLPSDDFLFKVSGNDLSKSVADVLEKLKGGSAKKAAKVSAKGSK